MENHGENEGLCKGKEGGTRDSGCTRESKGCNHGGKDCNEESSVELVPMATRCNRGTGWAIRSVGLISKARFAAETLVREKMTIILGKQGDPEMPSIEFTKEAREILAKPYKDSILIKV
ncbi:hypothetical protein PIB30_004536 [Stylosanthes scabra]|uniref:Uncharacterized protein n=1 Tax=Stylosanthes scabra TaxID=79078 RepID=A0ABU6Y0X7_9FABA|nr:hypothetical protein [Stylosanthes scabra]